MQSVITIPKEDVGTANFVANDVLSDPILIAERQRTLIRALSLGNLYRQKVTITYRLEDWMTQRVITTVWAVTDYCVTLKGGRMIPVHAIERVEL
ncbi:MAG: hypothetical protein WA958_10635 [Tunicatimonas sp.]